MADSNVLLLALVVLTAATMTTATVNVQQNAHFEPPSEKRSCSLVARFDMQGLRGSITFHQRPKITGDNTVTVVVNMMGLDQTNNTRYGWHVHEYPVTFGLLRESPCSQQQVGGHYDPLNRASSPTYENDCRNRKDLCEVGDLAGKFGPLQSNRSSYVFRDVNMNLYSSFSPVGRSIVIHQADGSRFACGNIDYDGNTRVETYRASFQNPPGPLQGDIILKRAHGKDGVTFHAELYRVDGGAVNMPFGWSLRAGTPNADGTCSNLRQVYGSSTHQDNLAQLTSRCSIQRQRSCFIGSLTQKCGNLIINNSTRRIKHFCTDVQLGHVTPNHYVDRTIAIEDSTGAIIACSQFQRVQIEAAEARFSSTSAVDQINVNAHFFQNDPHELTFVTVNTNRLLEVGSYFQIRQERVTTPGSCSNLGAVFEPRPGFITATPLPPIITGDFVPVGQLRYKIIPSSTHHTTRTVSHYLPLYGPFSIIGRSLVLHQPNGVVLACGNIERSYAIPNPNIPSILGYHIDTQ